MRCSHESLRLGSQQVVVLVLPQIHYVTLAKYLTLSGPNLLFNMWGRVGKQDEASIFFYCLQSGDLG